MRTDFISEIDASGKRHWCPGVFAIENVPTGRRHYIGTRNVGRRVRDNMNWLSLGVHHNRALQADWTKFPDQFRLVLIQKVVVSSLINMVKQSCLDRDRASTCGVYNRKNALPKTEKTLGCPLIIAE